MHCTRVRMPAGAIAFVCGSSAGRRWRCFCGLGGGYQCDWKLADGKTCDACLCPEHAKEVAPAKHLCPLHQEAYERWLAARVDKDGT